MTLFNVPLRPGQSIFDQLVSAAQKSILSGEFEKGQAFPSVRTIAAELRIHANTAHKVIQYLIQERWLEMMPGIGTVVAGPPRRLTDTRRELLAHEVSRLISEARRVASNWMKSFRSFCVKIGGSESFHMECGSNSRSRQG